MQLGSFSLRASTWLVVITFLAFALRLVRLDFQPLWWDEGYSVFFATRDFGTMLARTAIDIHPPLYYALLQLWMSVAGKSDVALRLFSVVIGTVTIPLLYALAQKLVHDTRIALIAAMLLALSPMHVYYSQEVRMYGLVTLLGLASVYLFAQLLPLKPGTVKSVTLALLYIPITTAALYTQYYAAFIVAFEILYAVWYFGRHTKPLLRWRSISELWANPLAHWMGAWLAIGALYLPWIIYAGPKLYTYVTSKVSIEKYAPLDPLTFLAQHLATFSTGHLTAWTWLAWASVVLVAFAVYGIFVWRQRQGDKETRNLLPVSLSPVLLVSLYLVVPLALGYVVNVVYPFHPIHSERLLLLAAPAFFLLTAVGITTIWNRRAWLGAIALLIVSVISAASLYDFYAVARYSKDDYRPLITEMQQSAQPGDACLAIYPWQIGYLESYYTGAPFNIVEPPSDQWLNNSAQMENEIQTLLNTSPRIWLPALQTQGRLLEDKLDAYLRPREYTVIDNWFGTTRLEMFAAQSDPPRSSNAIAIVPSMYLLTVNGWGISNQPIVAGQDILPIWFDWGAATPANLKISLRLVDSLDNIWAQDDRDIERGIQRIGFIVPIGTPPGNYALRIATYQTGDTSSKIATPLARLNITRPAQPHLAAISHRTSLDLANGIRLIGYDASGIAQPGEPAPITLFWQAARSIDKDYAVVTQVQDASGKFYATTQASPARNIYPTTQWQSNEIVRDPQTITVRGDTPDGDYRIVVAMIDLTGGTRTSSVQVGTITVKGRPHYFGAPSPSSKFDARFGDVARLVGYDVSNDDRAVHLVLYWQALASADTSYKVFVHLNDASGTLRAQLDLVPGAGAYPTTSWVKGEYLVDVYDITMPPSVPAGNYTIQIGMYEPTSGARLPVFDAAGQSIGDNIILPARISVK